MMRRAKFNTYGIDEWEKEFAEIYGNVDIQRKPTEMWLLLVEDSSKFAEFIRREKYAKALTALAHVFCWTCSFIWRCRSENDLGIQIHKPLSRIIWDKYPARCCLCGQERCICSVRRLELEELPEKKKKKKLEEIEEDLKIARDRTENIPSTLDDFTTMFSNIYKGAHYAMPIEAIAFHFMEEVGEVSTCIRRLREKGKGQSLSEVGVNRLKNNLENEIADVISWTMSLLSKLDYMLGAGVTYLRRFKTSEDAEKKELLQTASLRLSSIVWESYQTPDGNTLYCPVCKTRPCDCKPISL